MLKTVGSWFVIAAILCAAAVCYAVVAVACLFIPDLDVKAGQRDKT